MHAMEVGIGAIEKMVFAKLILNSNCLLNNSFWHINGDEKASHFIPP